MDKLTLEERVARIEKWIDFWETIETGWSIRADLPNKHTVMEPVHNTPDVVRPAGSANPTQNRVADCIYGNEDCPVCPTKTPK